VTGGDDGLIGVIGGNPEEQSKLEILTEFMKANFNYKLSKTSSFRRSNINKFNNKAGSQTADFYKVT